MVFIPLRIDNARYETSAELLSWQARSKPGSPQHIAATVELGRRADGTNRITFWVGFAVVAIALLGGTVALIRHWW